jgi:two-component system, NtrC family, sensor kinase
MKNKFKEENLQAPIQGDKNKKVEGSIGVLTEHQQRLLQLGQVAGAIGHEISNPIAYVKSNIESLSKYLEFLHNLLEKHKCLFLKIKSQSNVHPDIQKEIYEIEDFEVRIKKDFLMGDLEAVIQDSAVGIHLIEEMAITLKNYIRRDCFERKGLFSLNQIVNNAILLVAGTAKRIATIHRELNARTDCFCNKEQVTQVVMNILINGIHALENKTQTEEGRILIKTFEEEDFVACQIIDNGPGIPKEYLREIFEPFFTTKDIERGTGLGLSICYDIIKKKHGGEIYAENYQGMGASFTLKIPKVQTQI